MNPRRPRIAITPEALRTLRILAAMNSLEPSDYLSALVVQEGTRELGNLRTPRTSRIPAEPEPPRIPAGKGSPGPRKKKRNQPDTYRPPIKSQPELIKKIDDMRAGGSSLSEIARSIGYPVQTLAGFLQRRAKQL